MTTNGEPGQEAHERWHAAAHAVQSGVAAEMNFNPGPTTPKHLRTGLNIVMSDHGALAYLLIEKGIITESEYLEAIAAGMEREQAEYEKRLSAHYGTNITLG